MGRQVRKVAADWQHPKDASGAYIPLREHFPYSEAEIAEGIRDGWLTDEEPLHGIPVMPQWPAAQRTHLMMYETTTEGTPISPAFETPEELVRWLADSKASAYADVTASYDAWLAMINAGEVPSFGVVDGVLVSGVELAAQAERQNKTDGGA